MDAPRHRTRPLHNFALPELRWANQRLLRCMNLPHDAARRRRSPDSGDSDGIDAVREKLMLDLRAAADHMKLSMMPEKDTAAGELNLAGRPWNLRTRRAACKAPAAEKDSGCEVQRAEAKPSPLREVTAAPVKFSVPLTKAEIEEDFRAIAGVRPRRRPKKRSKTVQNELDQLFPGLWLTEITPETYKVDDVAGQER